MTASAQRRVRAEVEGIDALLGTQRSLGGGDASSRERQAARRRKEDEKLAQRLDTLRLVLEVSIVDPAAGGRKVTFGCRFSLRIGGGTVTQDWVVSTVENSGAGRADPFGPLGCAVAGKAAGATVTFDTPRGPQTATIVRVYD